MNEEIKALRREAKVSQLRLSQEAGVSRYRISLAECGYYELTSEEKARIEAALKNITKERRNAKPLE